MNFDPTNINLNNLISNPMEIDKTSSSSSSQNNMEVENQEKKLTQKRKFHSSSSPDSNKKVQSQLGLETLGVELLSKINVFVGLNTTVNRLNHYFHTCDLNSIDLFKGAITRFAFKAHPLCAAVQTWMTKCKAAFTEKNLQELVSFRRHLSNYLGEMTSRAILSEIDDILLKHIQKVVQTLEAQRKQCLLKDSSAQNAMEDIAEDEDRSNVVFKVIKMLLPVESINALMIEQTASLFCGLQGDFERLKMTYSIEKIPLNERVSVIRTTAPLIQGLTLAEKRVVCLAKVTGYSQSQRNELSLLHQAYGEANLLFGHHLYSKDIIQIRALEQFASLFAYKDQAEALSIIETHIEALMQLNLVDSKVKGNAYTKFIEILQFVPQHQRIGICSQIVKQDVINIDAFLTLSFIGQIPTDRREAVVELLILGNDFGLLHLLKETTLEHLTEMIQQIKLYREALNPRTIPLLLFFAEEFFGIKASINRLRQACSLYSSHPQKSMGNLNHIIRALIKYPFMDYELTLQLTQTIIDKFHPLWVEQRGENNYLALEETIFALSSCEQRDNFFHMLSTYAPYWTKKCGGPLEDILLVFSQCFLSKSIESAQADCQKALELSWNESIQQNLMPIFRLASHVKLDDWETLVNKANYVLLNFSFVNNDSSGKGKAIYSIKDFKFSGELLEILNAIPVENISSMISTLNSFYIQNTPIAEETLTVLIGLYELLGPGDYFKNQLMTWKNSNISSLLNLKFFDYLQSIKLKEKSVERCIEFVERYPNEIELIDFLFPICEEMFSNLTAASYKLTFLDYSIFASTLSILKKWRSIVEDKNELRENICQIPPVARSKIIGLIEDFVKQLAPLENGELENLINTLLKSRELADLTNQLFPCNKLFQLLAKFSPTQRRLFLNGVKNVPKKLLVRLLDEFHFYEDYKRLFDLYAKLDESDTLWDVLSQSHELINLINVTVPLFEYTDDYSDDIELIKEIGLIHPSDREDVVRRAEPFIKKSSASFPELIQNLGMIPPKERDVIFAQSQDYLDKCKSSVTIRLILNSFYFGKDSFVKEIFERFGGNSSMSDDEETDSSLIDSLLFCTPYISHNSMEKFFQTFEQRSDIKIKSGRSILGFVLRENPELAEETYAYLLTALQDKDNPQKVKFIADFIDWNFKSLNLYLEHSLALEAMKRLAGLNGDLESPKHSLQIHEKLARMDQEATPAITLPVEKIRGKSVRLNLPFFLQDSQEKRPLTFSQLPKNIDFIDSMLEEIQGRIGESSDDSDSDESESLSEEGKLNKYLAGMKVPLTFKQIGKKFEDVYWESLIALSGKPEDAAPKTYVRFCALMNYIAAIPHDLEHLYEDEEELLTKREETLMKISPLLPQDTFKAYNWLPVKYRLLEIVEANSAQYAIALIYLHEVVQKTLSNIFLNANSFMTQVANDQTVTIRQSLYLMNALYKRVGLQYDPLFIVNTEELSDHLLAQGLESLLKSFFDFALPSLFVKSLQASLQEDQVYEDKDNQNDKLYDSLTKLIAPMAENQIWSRDEKTGYRILNESAALELFLKVGYLVEG